MREKYWWLVAGGWFVVREKYWWLVADKPSEQGADFELCKEPRPRRGSKGSHQFCGCCSDRIFLSGAKN
jgi:hypothetical protein